MANPSSKTGRKSRNELRSFAPVARIALASCVALACHQPALASTAVAFSMQPRIKQVETSRFSQVAAAAKCPTISHGHCGLRVNASPVQVRNFTLLDFHRQVIISRMGGLYGP